MKKITLAAMLIGTLSSIALNSQDPLLDISALSHVPDASYYLQNAWYKAIKVPANNITILSGSLGDALDYCKTKCHKNSLDYVDTLHDKKDIFCVCRDLQQAQQGDLWHKYVTKK